MTTQHTPGPWSVSTAPGCVDVRGPDLDRNFIASLDVDKRVPLAEIDANAHLIAAAPELLAVLKEMLEDCDQTVELECVHGGEVVEKARAAIAKAEGK